MSLIRVAGRILTGVAMVGLAAVPIVGTAAAPRNQQTAKFDGSDVFRTYCVVCHGA